MNEEKVYKALRNYENILPERLLKMLNGMEKDNWLYNYKEDQGIKYSMLNVLHKAKYLEKDLPVFEVFLQNKQKLKKCFDVFFPELYAYAQKVKAGFN